MQKRKWILVAGIAMLMGAGARAESWESQEQAYDWNAFETVRVIVSKEVGPNMATYTAPVADCGRNLTHIRLRVARSGIRVDGGWLLA